MYSRKIVGWGISNSLAAQWCKDVLEDAIATNGKPEIINSDQGTQYTSVLWTQYLESLGIQISMDFKGRALDNTWIERFWRPIKYDYIYLNPAEAGFELYEEFKTISATIMTKCIKLPVKLPTNVLKNLLEMQLNY